MANKRIVVVGAGMAGLSAALRLSRAGAEVTVFESSDRVGGRTSSESCDGYLYERGTQFYVSTYRNALALIKDMGLQADLRPTSEWITVFHHARPVRMASGMLFVTSENAERMMEWPDEQIVNAVTADIERLFPGAMAAQHFARVVRWREGMPKSPVGRARTLAAYRATRPHDCRVWLAGDYMGMGTLESAIETGTWAATRILGS